ncbi:Glycoside hydrolase family 12 protein [Mycena chlorophos]|uniref:Glycoside hydrolase family 12 protein n=1 Tax=Mycena chlorophos TaxID=658473 RepID=A0A8H6WEP8_MYCCL|nr:Glycoside hydrolase family 12 protein [Mycena chlorophos]
MFTKLASLLLLLPFVAAISVVAPTNAEKRQASTSYCGQYDSVVEQPYTLYLDQWGMSGATSGSDCASITSLSGNTIAWTTTWTWTGGSGVKSFTNINLNTGINTQLSEISSIPTVWDWSQTTSGTVVADVAYDLFTSNTAGGSNVNEIMIWMLNSNAGPISYTYSSSGQPVPVVSNLSLGGYTWNLYQGSNGANVVFSFLPTSTTGITSFSADINLFLKYLTANYNVAGSQYLTTLQAGTEATSGSATLTTKAYSAVINTGGSTGTTTTKTTTTSKSSTSTTSTAPPSSSTVPVYGQCGGQGYPGSTTCASGSTCVSQNPYYSQLATLLLLVPFIAASPIHERAVEKREVDATTYCGQYDSVTESPYTLYLDQWGLSGATSGSDCASITSLSGTTIAWTTTWTWTGGSGVKSFTNINLNTGVNTQLFKITTIPTTWKWSQTTSGTVVADVAYDMFTSSSSGGSAAYEVMIWLLNSNAGPISYTYSSSGQPVPVASNISLGGHTWNLYEGSNGSNIVFSFLPTSAIESFSADIITFFKYLESDFGLSSSQYLTTVQAGTEATSGSATLTTSAYSVVIN